MNEQRFPTLWGQFFDETVPTYVKQRYSPNPKWRDKPFSLEDLNFYAKGVKELSHLLRSDRHEVSQRQVASYFEHPKNRSAYLLYFLNLQAAKFFTMFERHSDALSKAFDIARSESRPFRVLDLGAGPGTASIALLLWAQGKKNCPEFELTLVDQHMPVLDDAKALLSAGRTPAKDIRIIRSNCYDFRFDGVYDFSILGHLLNETETPLARQAEYLSLVENHTSGAGVLIVEPADKISSQNLGSLRNELLGVVRHHGDEGDQAPSLKRLWGPCMHEGTCPLSQSRDWCHFSFPAEIPGKWFRQFSERLGSKREWLKFSYLWIASAKLAPPMRPAHLRLVVSEIMRQHEQTPLVLLCEPDQTKRISLDVLKTKSFKIFRGDVVKYPDPNAPADSRPRVPQKDRPAPRDREEKKTFRIKSKPPKKVKSRK
ncbi:MAG: hypothetical protein KA715_05715 [Xanthomonadaceae bacterium]|nr:hypothetical protein [Xanthomonadaceae bacterium]